MEANRHGLALQRVHNLNNGDFMSIFWEYMSSGENDSISTMTSLLLAWSQH